MAQLIGLIAGAGDLPVLTAKGIREAGHEVACVGMRGHVDEQIRDLCTEFSYAGALQLGRWIRQLRRWNVSHAVVIGKIHKVRIYNLWQLLQMRPDLQAARVWYIHQRHDRGDAGVLGAGADIMAQNGINLLEQTQFISQTVAETGVMTTCSPSASQLADIAYGWPRVRAICEQGIGQTIAVHGCSVLAVEAIEGTDAMIQRAGQLSHRRPWTMLKAASDEHDMRLDVPTVGLETIENLNRAGAKCLVLAAGKTIMAQKEQMLALAQKYGISVVGQ